jgi:predicted nucleotidyltransferase
MNAAVRLRRSRQAAGLSQAELAARAGTSQPTLSAYERGSKTPTSATLHKLLEATGVRPSTLAAAHHDEILNTCRRSGAEDVRVFGSIARGEDTVDGDIDLLVRFSAGTSLIDHARLVAELTDLLGIPVDVISEGALRLPDDQHILDEARSL